jgi:hypothetical protein
MLSQRHVKSWGLTNSLTYLEFYRSSDIELVFCKSSPSCSPVDRIWYSCLSPFTDNIANVQPKLNGLWIENVEL